MPRAVLVLALSLAALLAGCGATAGPLAPDTATPSVTETAMPTPAPPDRLTRERGITYADANERALVYNERSGNGATATEVSCDSWADRWVEQSLYVVAVCGGSVGGDAGAKGSFREPPAIYRLDESETERVPLDDARVPEIYRATSREQNVDIPRDIAVVNFASERRSLSLTVTHRASGDVAFETSPTVAPDDDVTFRSFVARSGTYRVVARLDDGTTVRYRWRVTPTSRPRAFGLGVYVTPEGGLSVETFRSR